MAGTPSRGREPWLRGPLLSRWHPLTLRAALWTARSVRAARRRLPREGVRTRVRPPPVLPAGSGRGVQAVLRRQDSTCLERALVLQRWLVAHGEAHEVIIGVRAAGDGVEAHAWLDFEADDPQVKMYQELTRMEAP